MLGHLDVPGLTEPGTPASLSPATVRLLRGELGFAGVVMTDDLAAMASITDRVDPGEAAVRALAAGVDVVLLSGADVPALLDRLEAAVAAGTLTEAAVDASVVRTLALRGIDACGVDL
jgi:beta-N-acetylhexosaminidase